jgi:hypothetical protein
MRSALYGGKKEKRARRRGTAESQQFDEAADSLRTIAKILKSRT